MIDVLSNIFQERLNIDLMRVASPCPMNWAAMTGDERARYYDLSMLHVYNISEMTSSEVKKLIASTEGRLCVRLYKRADGTVLTKDCPVGLRAIRRKVGKMTSATLTAIIGLCVSTFGKPILNNPRVSSRNVNIVGLRLNAPVQVDRAEISGRVLDQNGAIIELAKVTIINQNTGKKSITETKADGTFQVSMLRAGLYSIEIEAPAFSPFQRTDIDLGASDTFNEDIVLEVAGGMVGVIGLDEPNVTSEGPGTRRVLKSKQILNLPY